MGQSGDCLEGSRVVTVPSIQLFPTHLLCGFRPLMSAGHFCVAVAEATQCVHSSSSQVTDRTGFAQQESVLKLECQVPGMYVGFCWFPLQLHGQLTLVVQEAVLGATSSTWHEPVPLLSTQSMSHVHGQLTEPLPSSFSLDARGDHPDSHKNPACISSNCGPARPSRHRPQSLPSSPAPVISTHLLSLCVCSPDKRTTCYNGESPSSQ